MPKMDTNTFIMQVLGQVILVVGIVLFVNGLSEMFPDGWTPQIFMLIGILVISIGMYLMAKR